MRTSMRLTPNLMPNHLNFQVFSIGDGSSFGARIRPRNEAAERRRRQ
jgi:hypothetical protein